MTGAFSSRKKPMDISLPSRGRRDDHLVDDDGRWDAEQVRHRVAVDVRVEDPDGGPCRQRGSEAAVSDDLPPALAAAIYTRGAVEAMPSCARDPASELRGPRGLPLRGHDVEGYGRASHAGDDPDVPRDLLLEARAERTTGDGERDGHRHVPGLDPDLAHHVQIGDRAPKLRVDDLLERLPDLVARRLHRD
jgi:hypothetical protein